MLGSRKGKETSYKKKFGDSQVTTMEGKSDFPSSVSSFQLTTVVKLIHV